MSLLRQGLLLSVERKSGSGATNNEGDARFPVPRSSPGRVRRWCPVQAERPALLPPSPPPPPAPVGTGGQRPPSRKLKPHTGLVSVAWPAFLLLHFMGSRQ